MPSERLPSGRIKLGGLWQRRTRDGREYLTGKLSPTVKILIFKNDFRTSDTQPSHVMYLAPAEPAEAEAPETTQAMEADEPSPQRSSPAGSASANAKSDRKAENSSFAGDSYPFSDEDAPPP